VLDLELFGSGLDLEMFAGDCSHDELESCRAKGTVLLKVCLRTDCVKNNTERELSVTRIGALLDYCIYYSTASTI